MNNKFSGVNMRRRDDVQFENSKNSRRDIK